MAEWARGQCAIVGVGESGLGLAEPGLSPADLAAQAAIQAVADAGLRMHDIDGLFTASAYYPMGTLNIAEYLGLQPTYADGTNIGGSSFISHLLHACVALSAGLCTNALIVYASTQRSDGGRLVSPVESSVYEAPHSPREPVTMYALAAARHMHEFGTTREHLAHVAVEARRWAQLTPDAFAREPLTVAEVLNSRIVSSPLSVLDCCLVTDGAGAVVVTRADRACGAPKAPVYVLGAAEAQTHRSISQMPSLVTTAAARSGPEALRMAGVSPSEVDLVEVYDAFTINTVVLLEDLGFCAKGEGGPFVSSGAIGPGGALPTNTNGGGLAYCHPGMYGIFLLVEATRQLRHEAGQRQVPDAELALVNGNGGVFSSQVSAVLGSGATR